MWPGLRAYPSEVVFCLLWPGTTELKIQCPLYVTLVWRILDYIISCNYMNLHKFQFYIHVTCWSINKSKGEPSLYSKRAQWVTAMHFLDIMCLLFCWESSPLRVLVFRVIIQYKALLLVKWLLKHNTYQRLATFSRKAILVFPL